MDAQNESSRVTNAILSTKIDSIMDSLKEIKNDLKNLDSIPTRVSTLEKEQEKLREKSDLWNGLNTFGVFIAGLFGAFFGK